MNTSFALRNLYYRAVRGLKILFCVFAVILAISVVYAMIWPTNLNWLVIGR